MKEISAKYILKFQRHFMRYLFISIMTFSMILVFGLTQIIMYDSTGNFLYKVPVSGYYLAAGIALVMMVIGGRYLYTLHNTLTMHLEKKIK